MQRRESNKPCLFLGCFAESARRSCGEAGEPSQAKPCAPLFYSCSCRHRGDVALLARPLATQGPFQSPLSLSTLPPRRECAPQTAAAAETSSRNSNSSRNKRAGRYQRPTKSSARPLDLSAWPAPPRLAPRCSGALPFPFPGVCGVGRSVPRPPSPGRPARPSVAERGWLIGHPHYQNRHTHGRQPLALPFFAARRAPMRGGSAGRQHGALPLVRRRCAGRGRARPGQAGRVQASE